MKKLTLLLGALAVIGLCLPANAFFGLDKHKSRIEAKIACEKWASKGGFFTQKNEWEDGRTTTKKQPVRACIEEKDTRQFLGWWRMGKSNESVWNYKKGDINWNAKVVRRFKY